MATPAKVKKSDGFDESVEGYIHCVSPVKLSAKSNTTYFNCLLQTDRTTYTDVVSFSPEKRQFFQQAAEQKTAVRFRNVSRVLSFTSANGNSVRCNRGTHLSTTELKYPYLTKETQNPAITIRDVGSKPVGDYVTVKLEIEDYSFPIEQKTTRFGTTVPMKNATVADATGSVKLCVSITGTPVLADVAVNLKCVGCSRSLPTVPENCPTIKCEQCKMRQNKTAASKSIVLKIKLDSSDVRYIVYSSTIHTFLSSINKGHLEMDPDGLEEYLLATKLVLTLPNATATVATKMATA